MHTMTFMTNSFWNLQNKNHRAPFRGMRTTTATLFSLLLAALSSCSQDPDKIGIGLLPDDDFIEIGSTDTVGIRAYTMYNDLTLTTDYTRMIAGSVYDDYFGSTYCDLVTQLRLMTKWPAREFEIDSVLLTFVPSRVSGNDSTAIHFIRLCETGTLITDSTDFYSGQDPDTIMYLGEYRLPDLEAGSPAVVKLHNWVGEHLLRDTTKLSSGARFYEEYFRGLYFAIKSVTEPIIVEMNASELSSIDPLGITIFYRSDTLKYNYSFVATPRAVNYNRFTHDRSTADPALQITHVNDMVTDTAVFMQNYMGLYVKLDLPSLEAYKNVSNLAVNKARIIAPVHLDDEYFPEKELPSQIYVRYRNSEGRELPIPDLVHDISFMDGKYYSDKDSYIFNITSFVQAYLNGEIDEPSVELYLPINAVKNVIFKANTNEPAFKLEFAYTLY